MKKVSRNAYLALTDDLFYFFTLRKMYAFMNESPFMNASQENISDVKKGANKMRKSIYCRHFLFQFYE